MSRTATVERSTSETAIELSVDLDGGAVEAATGVGFFDHMLDLLGRHGRLGLRVEARGDLQTGSHHTVEDVGIALGQALDRALGDRAGIRRYGHALVPMDEALARCVIDSRAPVHALGRPLPPVSIANYEVELTEEFFRAVATNAKLTLHLESPYGIEHAPHRRGMLQGLRRALRDAVAIDPGESGVPSTKGTLSD